MVTGKEDDGKAALAAEASLKDAIDQAMKGTTNPARLDQVTQLEQEFETFTRSLPISSSSRTRAR